MNRKWGIILGIAGLIYLLAPFIAGSLEIGARRGPVFYPSGFHSTLFILGCESFHDYKPREGYYSIFYRKALFYGLPERPYAKEVRLQMIEDRRIRGMPPEILNRYIEMEAKITEYENAEKA